MDDLEKFRSTRHDQNQQPLRHKIKITENIFGKPNSAPNSSDKVIATSVRTQHSKAATRNSKSRREFYYLKPE